MQNGRAVGEITVKTDERITFVLENGNGDIRPRRYSEDEPEAADVLAS